MNSAIILSGLFITGILLVYKIKVEFCSKKLVEEDKSVLISRDKILVYGDREVIQDIKEKCHDIASNAVFTDSTSIDREWTNIYCVVALSKSDSNNILFCNLVKKFYGSIDAFGICNETINRKLFIKNNICIIKMECFFDEYIVKGYKDR